MNIGFIGAGKMGEAYISALHNENTIKFYETNEERAKYISENYKAENEKNLNYFISDSDYIILAVKPQNMKELLNKISSLNVEGIKNKIFISIAAGVKIKSMINWFENDKIKIVRVMPNTPCLIKKGISGYTFNENIKDEDIENIEKILNATGEIVKVKENELDIVTAISGSGPAYVFVMLNSIADAGVKLGMTKESALKLAAETFIGSAELLKQTKEHPEKLKDNVTSPGGTTAAGLFKMEENNIRKALIETIEAAYMRSKELGKEE